MKRYNPETKWLLSDEHDLVYTLKQKGWKKGLAVFENDISISIRAPKEMRIEFAKLILDTMNVNYPHTESPK